MHSVLRTPTMWKSSAYMFCQRISCVSWFKYIQCIGAGVKEIYRERERAMTWDLDHVVKSLMTYQAPKASQLWNFCWQNMFGLNVFAYMFNCGCCIYILFTLPLHAPVETLIYVVVLVHFTGNLPPLSQDHIPHCQWPCWHVWETVFICATCTPQPVYITDWNDDGTVTPFDITTDLCLWQELEYCEFFAGAARVFEEVKGAAYPSTAVDIEYMKNVAHEGRTNLFDFMTPCGFGSFVCKSVSNEVCLLEWIFSLVFVGWILFILYILLN